MRNFAQDIISSVGVLVYLKQTRQKKKEKEKKASVETKAVTMIFLNHCASEKNISGGKVVNQETWRQSLIYLES